MPQPEQTSAHYHTRTFEYMALLSEHNDIYIALALSERRDVYIMDVLNSTYQTENTSLLIPRNIEVERDGC